MVDRADMVAERDAHGMGLLSDPDERDLQYPMQAMLAMEETFTLPTQMFYQTGPILNQGRLPQCVGFSWKQWLQTGPTVNLSTHPTPTEIYCAAQKLDPWVGDCTNPRYNGSTVRAGAQALQGMQFVTSYVWAWDAETIRRWILSGKGPVVVGTRWYPSMFTPVKSIITVDTSVAPAGGHAYLLSGYTDNGRFFEITNSWGAYWGAAGKAKIRYSDMDILLGLQGEAATAVEHLVIPVAAS